ncbi:MAG: hypothetical protein P1U42_03780 [Phycisphaerales bacterium]|nr:hypothetical protein [Phycisphaerales bacterium]
MKYILTVVVLSVLSWNQAFGSQDSVSFQLQDAFDTLDLGIEYLESNNELGQGTLKIASAKIEAVMREHNLSSPGLYLALGNAYRLQGDLGHAILAYRRGESLDPTDKALQDSLESTRDLIELNIQPDSERRVISWILSWRGKISRTFVWSVFIASFSMGWILCSLSILGLAHKRVRTIGIWSICCSVVPISLLGVEWTQNQASNGIVVVENHVIAQSGPDDSIYDAVFAEPLQSGVEGVQVETRSDWSMIRLFDGVECWIPSDTFEFINPQSDL